MRHVTTIALLVLLSISVRALPQVPAAAATGSIEGIVVRSDNGAPVAGAQVQLTFAPLVNPGAVPVTGAVLGGVLTTAGGAPLPQAPPGSPIAAAQQLEAAARPTFQPVVTGADGKFTFKDIAAGGYRIAATADGFVRQEVGQRTVTGQGRPVFVTANQVLKDATIRLIATGTVSGRVFDENGQPATGAPVQLLRSTYNVQGRVLQSVANGIADDRGDYRVFGVPPGRYYLLAGTPPGGALGLRGGLAGGTGAARFGLLYYPNAENVDQALIVEVKPGEQASVDMRLRRQLQTYRVRGRIVDGTGVRLPANVQVNLAYRFLTGSGSMGSARAFDPATGTFELQNVAPGDWMVAVSVPVTAAELPPAPAGPLDPAAQAARQAMQASRPNGSVPIKVVDKDVEGLVVTLSTGVNITGRITIEGPQQVSLPANLRFTLQPVTPLVNQTAPAVFPAAADGSFQVVGLRETEYRAQFPVAAIPGMYVKSITYGGDDILSKPLKFSGSGTGTFDVVLRPGAVQVTGTVTDVTSQPVAGTQVVLIPAQRTRQDLYRPSLTDQNGRFTLANVAPGEYKVFSWEAIDANSYFDPDVLTQYEQQGKAVRVNEGSALSVDVKVIPAP